jgi:flagellar biogenesis protein FliO
VVPLRPIEHQEIHPRAEAAATQTAGGGGSIIPSGVMGVLQVAAALAVVIGLIFIGKAMAKKFLPAAKAGNGKGVIEILARYPLAKNQSLVLVRIGSQIVTLNQGKEQSQSVLVINDPNEVAKILGQIEGTSPKSIQAGFNKILANARMDLESSGGDEADFESRSMEPENLDTQLEEMAAAKRQLMELRQQVRSVRDSLPR